MRKNMLSRERLAANKAAAKAIHMAATNKAAAEAACSVARVNRAVAEGAHAAAVSAAKNGSSRVAKECVMQTAANRAAAEAAWQAASANKTAAQTAYTAARANADVARHATAAEINAAAAAKGIRRVPFGARFRDRGDAAVDSAYVGARANYEVCFQAAITAYNAGEVTCNDHNEPVAIAAYNAAKTAAHKAACANYAMAGAAARAKVNDVEDQRRMGNGETPKQVLKKGYYRPRPMSLSLIRKIGAADMADPPKPRKGWVLRFDAEGLFTYPKLDARKFGPHTFARPYDPGYISPSCPCGCWMSSSNCGGPVDPDGPCPLNPKPVRRKSRT